MLPYFRLALDSHTLKGFASQLWSWLTGTPIRLWDPDIAAAILMPAIVVFFLLRRTAQVRGDLAYADLKRRPAFRHVDSNERASFKLQIVNLAEEVEDHRGPGKYRFFDHVRSTGFWDSFAMSNRVLME